MGHRKKWDGPVGAYMRSREGSRESPERQRDMDTGAREQAGLPVRSTVGRRMNSFAAGLEVCYRRGNRICQKHLKRDWVKGNHYFRLSHVEFQVPSRNLV